MQIQSANNFTDKSYYEQVKNIFWLTSSRTEFRTIEQKLKFQEQYLDYYWNHWPQLFFFAVEDEKVLGYICGVLDSSKEKRLYEIVAYYRLFEDFFITYPSHLHINMHPDAQGKGLGSQLLAVFEYAVKEMGSLGVFLITSLQAQNVKFYQKNAYTFSLERRWCGAKILFMGKSLTES